MVGVYGSRTHTAVRTQRRRRDRRLHLPQQLPSGPGEGTRPVSDPNDPDDGSHVGREAGTIRYRYDWEAVRPSTAVVKIVSVAADVEPTDLDPLYDTFDPEALDQVIRRDGSGGPCSETTVSFTYGGHDVAVCGDGEVSVTPTSPEDGGPGR